MAADATPPALPGTGTLTEAASKRYLAACGLPIPQGRLATSLAEARDAADALGCLFGEVGLAGVWHIGRKVEEGLFFVVEV